ncbi:MAG: TonB-dependent receptor [Ignavibacteriales bacterium]|nr:TonB-dependent receptor [Ignavibacteriales bacterium]
MITLISQNKYILAALLVLFTATDYFCGTTGKIAGTVTDAKTKELLIGVNIQVTGTRYGGVSDAEGNFFIINLPPGVYEIKASYIGYSQVNIKNVRVSVDQTSRLDIELASETLQLNSIVVTSQAPIVRKDLTSTENKISADDIAMLPVEDVAGVVNLQAGVVDGHFRGGRGGEVKYLIDGVSVNDALSGQSALTAEVNSIQELQVLTGTFNAEYGEALSGVVNQITKIAGENYAGSLTAYAGDYISSHKDVFQNIDNVSPTAIHNVQGTFSGPVPGTGDYLKFFLSGRYVYDDGYMYGKRKFNPSDSSNFSANNPAEWYVGATGDNKYASMNYNRRGTLQAKLQYKLGGGKGLVLNTMMQNQEYKEYNHSYRLNPDGDYTNHQNNSLVSLSYTHVFNKSIFLDALASYVNTDFKRYVFENPLDERYVNPDRLKDVSGNAFLTGGTQNWHFYHTSTIKTAKIDITSQLNQLHEMKSGFEFNLHTLRYKDLQIVIDANSNYKPSMPKDGTFNYNVYTNHPVQFAYYLQDKIELDYLVVNIGARFDLFQPDAKVLKDPDNIGVLDDLTPAYPDSLFTTATAKYQISPRLGISYPMSDKGAIHISYGHFFQVPPFEYLYKNPNFRIPLTGDYPQNIGTSIGNADLKPQQTTMYEIGLQQELFPGFGTTVTAYYKDIRNLLGTEIHIKNEFKKYAKFVNRDYGAVSGFTLSFEKQFADGFGAGIDYTYQVAKGNASDPNDAYNKAQASPPVEANKQLVFLDWDRRHSINFSLTLGETTDYIASFIGRFGTGLPYTPSLQNQRVGLENSDNKPTMINVDFYYTKFLQLDGYKLAVFLKIYNLFDTENELNVFGDTGRSGYTLDLTRAQEAPRGVNTLADYYTRPDFYSAPRQVILGASIDF